LRRSVDRKLRRHTPVRLNFDRRQLPGAALAESRGRKVGGKHIRISVPTKPRISRVRVVPGPSGQPRHPGPDGVVDSQPRHAATRRPRAGTWSSTPTPPGRPPGLLKTRTRSPSPTPRAATVLLGTGALCGHAVASRAAATAWSSILAPNGSAPAWKVSRAGAFAGSGNCLRHQALRSP